MTADRFQRLLDQRQDICGDIAELRNDLQSKLNELADLDAEIASLRESAVSEEHNLPEIVSTPLTRLEFDSSAELDPIEKFFCNCRGLSLSTVDDYTLIVLYNQDQFRAGTGRTIAQICEAMTGSGLRCTNGGDIAKEVALATDRLKEEGLVRSRQQTFSLTTKGSKQVASRISNPSLSDELIISYLTEPITLPDLVDHIADRFKISEPQEVANHLKSLVAARRVEKLEGDPLPLYRATVV